MHTIDVFSEQLLDFAAAAKACPGRRKPHLMTVHRWAKEGIRGVTLASVFVNGERYTTRRALNDFFTATSTIPKDRKSRAPAKRSARTV